MLHLVTHFVADVSVRTFVRGSAVCAFCDDHVVDVLSVTVRCNGHADGCSVHFSPVGLLWARHPGEDAKRPFCYCCARLLAGSACFRLLPNGRPRSRLPTPLPPPPPKRGTQVRKIQKNHWGIIFGPKMMILQGVRRQKPYIGVCYANDPQKRGYMTLALALDLPTSLRGDFTVLT